MTNSSYLPKVK